MDLDLVADAGLYLGVQYMCGCSYLSPGEMLIRGARRTAASATASQNPQDQTHWVGLLIERWRWSCQPHSIQLQEMVVMIVTLQGGTRRWREALSHNPQDPADFIIFIRCHYDPT